MKKSAILLTGAIALAASSSFAAIDRLNIYTEGQLTRALHVDDIENISYKNRTVGGEGVTHMNVTFKNGDVKLIPISEIGEMEYAVGTLPSSPFAVEVNPHHMCATLDVAYEGSDWFRIVGVPEKSLASWDDSIWGEILVESDIDFIHYVCEENGIDLADYDLNNVFWTGSQKVDWFPSEVISANTPVVLCLYTVKIDGNDITPTCEPHLIRFTTKENKDLGTRWNVTAEMTSTSIKVIADAIDGADTPFAIELYDPVDVYENGLPAMVANSLSTMEQMVYNYGSSWDKLLYSKHGEKTYKNRKSGDTWMAVVFGVEYGVATTDASYEFFEIPMSVVTDDCTFTSTVKQISPLMVNIEVTPSSDDTMYAAFLVESDKIADEDAAKADEKAYAYISDRVYWANTRADISWTKGDYVHKGAATLNTYSNVVDKKYLKANTDYTVLICGVDSVGTVTTALHRVPVRTVPAELSGDLTFDVTFGEFDTTSVRLQATLPVKITPSDPEANYVCEWYRADNYYVSNDRSDETLVDELVNSYGKWLPLQQGEANRIINISSSSGTSNLFDTPYRLILFGYDGTPTSPVYMYEIDAQNQTVIQLRGPGAGEENAAPAE